MKQFWICLRMFLWLSLITGVIYPLVITGISYLFMHDNAEGSMIVDKGKIIGSRLIGQKFSSDIYFWPRPSANDYNPLKSGGSNLSPSSLALKKLVDARIAVLTSNDGMSNTATIPTELLFASGSGLDPHISLDAAFFQMDRILKGRGVEPITGKPKLQELINEMTINQYMRFFSASYVNVLELNIALDEKFPGINK